MFSRIMEYDICDWVSVGHDHNNDFYGMLTGVNLSYSRKIGYGSYMKDSL